MIDAQIIADSTSPADIRITTLQLRYPRFIHAELLTHRVFSRNASSSRAIPVKKMLEMVRDEPAMPVHWGKNQPGMQAHETLQGQEREQVEKLWREAAEAAADFAEKMALFGAHKQVANRILEPFQHISVVLTATAFSNWFELRDHEDAQPEIRELARQMRAAMDASTPAMLQSGEWHLPYISPTECAQHADDTELLRRVSAARCCRVSYLKHDGTKASVEEELALCRRLIGARPLHASPFEHQATPDEHDAGEWHNPRLHGNFTGWIQSRKLIEAREWL